MSLVVEKCRIFGLLAEIMSVEIIAFWGIWLWKIDCQFNELFSVGEKGIKVRVDQGKSLNLSEFVFVRKTTITLGIS